MQKIIRPIPNSPRVRLHDAACSAQLEMLLKAQCQ